MAGFEGNRRAFLGKLAAFTGGAVLFPMVTRCATTDGGSKVPMTAGSKKPKADVYAPGSSIPVPKMKPAEWDAIAFNRKRGNDGAIPKSYLASINGPDGDKKHLGKHLPFIPTVDPKLVPEGYIGLMWGDPSKGYSRHPTAAKDPSRGYHGHWYDSIKIRKAVEVDTEELKNAYPQWPGESPDDKGHFAVLGGGDISADKGRNTIYLVKLPAGLNKGDSVRIWGHCLYHGEYVDFLTI